jgi:hypothetical protein
MVGALPEPGLSVVFEGETTGEKRNHLLRTRMVNGVAEGTEPFGFSLG